MSPPLRPGREPEPQQQICPPWLRRSFLADTVAAVLLLHPSFYTGGVCSQQPQCCTSPLQLSAGILCTQLSARTGVLCKKPKPPCSPLKALCQDFYPTELWERFIPIIRIVFRYDADVVYLADVLGRQERTSFYCSLRGFCCFQFGQRDLDA